MAITQGTVIGQFKGVSLAAAFSNPSGQDILQVVNQSGKVVYKLDKNGVATANPSTYTMAGGKPVALYQQNGAVSLAAAFTNPGHLDLIQVISPTGEAPVFHVDYLGAAFTP